jgi:hypothetical protein
VNDENFIIITGNKKLAAVYWSNIMAIYNQYRWRWRRLNVKGADKWEGLVDRDDWQIDESGGAGAIKPYDQRRLRELRFWFGEG